MHQIFPAILSSLSDRMVDCMDLKAWNWQPLCVFKSSFDCLLLFQLIVHFPSSFFPFSCPLPDPYDKGSCLNSHTQISMLTSFKLLIVINFELLSFSWWMCFWYLFSSAMLHGLQEATHVANRQTQGKLDLTVCLLLNLAQLETGPLSIQKLFRMPSSISIHLPTKVGPNFLYRQAGGWQEASISSVILLYG